MVDVDIGWGFWGFLAILHVVGGTLHDKFE
jgi:hypothetical protein